MGRLQITQALESRGKENGCYGVSANEKSFKQKI